MTSDPLQRQVAGMHYANLAIQPIEYCHRNRLGPCESMAIKYISRHQVKHGAEDIRKAIHCLEMLLWFEYRGSSAGDTADESRATEQDDDDRVRPTADVA